MKLNKLITIDSELVAKLKDKGMKLSTTLNQLLKEYLKKDTEVIPTKQSKHEEMLEEHKKHKEFKEVYTSMKEKHGEKTTEQLQILINHLINIPETNLNKIRIKCLNLLITEKIKK